MNLEGIDHVQLAMPPGGEADAVAYYSGVLGLPQRPKPAELAARGGCWFESAVVKLHLGVEPNFVAARKAHPALLVDDLPELLRRIEDAGYRHTDVEVSEGRLRAYADDPFGNRLELIAV